MTEDNKEASITRLPTRKEMLGVITCIPQVKEQFLKQIGVLDVRPNMGYLDLLKLLELVAYQERVKVQQMIFRRVVIGGLVFLAIGLLIGRYL